MKTLDELLSERAQAEYKNALSQVLDPVSWTEANRDAKLAEIRKLAEGVCNISEDFVKELLTKEIESKSILWHKIKEQFIVGELELLMGFRDELDSLGDQPMNMPISYDWLNTQIKLRYQEITNLNIEISKAISPVSEVEDL